jgi:hypothetical protein
MDQADQAQLAELARALSALRLTRIGTSSGLSEDEAMARAWKTVREGLPSTLAALGTPDGAIVVNVATYLTYVGPITKGVFDVDDPPQTPEFRAASARAIHAIEIHRSKTWPGHGTISDRFTDYIYYRTRLETQAQALDAKELGYDHELVSLMVKFCIAALAPRFEQQKTSSPCFVATVCFGSPADQTVVSLREFRDTRLRHFVVGQSFIRWYDRRGPLLAAWIAERPRARFVARFVLREVSNVLSRLSGIGQR